MSEDNPARLVIRLGSQPEQTFQLTQDSIILGREAVNELVINDPEVSRRHARIVRRPDGYLLEDLGSTNGTFLNGRRVTTPTPLYHSDTIELGQSTVITVWLTPDPPGAPAVQPAAAAGYDAYANISDDAADYYARPKGAPVVVPLSPDPPARPWRRLFMSCGCLILLLILLLAAALFILDRTAPDFLYCGPLQSFWRAILEPILNLFGRSLNCPIG